MSEAESHSGPLARWVGTWANFIAPISVLSALLFYFGYVSARAQYDYFGIDVDVIGLGTQEYIMRSPQPLLVPLLSITLFGIAGMVLDSAVRGRIEAAADSPSARSARLLRFMIGLARTVGILLATAGILLVLMYAYLQAWPFYSLVTPLMIAVGVGLAMYGRRSADRLSGNIDVHSTDSSLARRRTAILMGYVVIVVSVFWATATLAEWTGRGRAQDQARRLDQLPRVILDSKERLFLRSPVVEESILPVEEGQTFRYRYRNLRLLIVGHDRMFLVPEQWSASNTTLVVAIDDSTRVQFQFQNQQP